MAIPVHTSFTMPICQAFDLSLPISSSLSLSSSHTHTHLMLNLTFGVLIFVCGSNKSGRFNTVMESDLFRCKAIMNKT